MHFFPDLFLENPVLLALKVYQALLRNGTTPIKPSRITRGLTILSSGVP